MPAGGGEVYIPAGDYRLNATLVLGNRHISFRGEGAKQSTLAWESPAVDGIVFTPTDETKTLRMVGVTLIRGNDLDNGVAIKAIWPAITSGGHEAHGFWSVVIDQVYIQTWVGHIELEDATHAKISNFSLAGKYGTTVNIVLKGLNVPVYITKGDIWDGTTGIKAFGGGDYHRTEGLHITDVELGAVDVGIDLSRAVGTSVANSHVNAQRVGIAVSDSNAIAFTGNTIFGTFGRDGNPATWDFMGFYITGNSYNLRLTGNHITAFNTAQQGPASIARGIFVNGPGPYGNVISNNTASEVGYGIQLWPGTCDNSVTGNNMRRAIYAMAYIIPPDTVNCQNLGANNF